MSWAFNRKPSARIPDSLRPEGGEFAKPDKEWGCWRVISHHGVYGKLPVPRQCRHAHRQNLLTCACHRRDEQAARAYYREQQESAGASQ